RRVLLCDRPRRGRDPAAARARDVRLLARRRLVGAHPRAEANRPALPAVGGVRRSLGTIPRVGLTLAEAAAVADELANQGKEREEAARSGDYRERAVAYRAIGQLRFRQKTELLRRGLEDESPACRGSALLSLELLSRDAPREINAVRPLLHTLANADDNPAVR